MNMNYKMKVQITDPNTQDEMCYKLECSFVYDKEQYERLYPLVPNSYRK